MFHELTIDRAALAAGLADFCEESGIDVEEVTWSAFGECCSDALVELMDRAEDQWSAVVSLDRLIPGVLAVASEHDDCVVVTLGSDISCDNGCRLARLRQDAGEFWPRGTRKQGLAHVLGAVENVLAEANKLLAPLAAIS